MRLVVTRTSMNTILRWARRLFAAAAIAMFGYCGLVLTDALIFQNEEHGRLDRLLAERQAANREARPNNRPTLQKKEPAAWTVGLVGRIEIPRLGLSAMVMEGISSKTLRRAVGHIPGTALPGQPGNVGISGHRDTFFRPLRNIRADDIITLITPLGEYRYRVVSTNVVDPSNIGVLVPGGTEVLTLVTCYPFYFVGSAPERFIVRAERVG